MLKVYNYMTTGLVTGFIAYFLEKPHVAAYLTQTCCLTPLGQFAF